MNRYTSIFTCTALILGATLASAQPRGRGGHLRAFQSQRALEDVESARSDDTKPGLVCLECHDLSEGIASEAVGSMAFCKVGGEVQCPACTRTYKTVRRGPPGKSLRHRQVIYVNDDGVQCAFMTKANAIGEAGSREGRE